MERDLVRNISQVVAMSGGQIIYNFNGLAFVQEQANERRAYESGAAGDNAAIHELYGSGLRSLPGQDAAGGKAVSQIIDRVPCDDIGMARKIERFQRDPAIEV